MQTFEKGHKDPDKFMWVTKGKARFTQNFDLSITLNKASINKGARACIHLHNYASQRVSTSGYVVFGIDGDRLYIKDSDSLLGFKLTTQTDGRNAILQVSDKNFTEWCRNHIGGYMLHQDGETGLYYCDCRRLV